MNQYLVLIAQRFKKDLSEKNLPTRQHSFYWTHFKEIELVIKPTK